MMFWLIVGGAWIAVGLAAAPFVFRTLSVIDSAVKLDRAGLIFAAVLGPIPAICIAIPRVLALAGVVVGYVLLGIGSVVKRVFK